MILRKLEQKEHGKTRPLWERVFPEDTTSFLDYYYRVKTADNTIYVVEEDGEIVSMLHLNPYTLQIGKEIVTCHYIVAVATEEAYRGRGYMSRLLEQAEKDMKENEEPFTYLMPAAEAIYYPHGYRYVYEQSQCHVTGKKGQGVYDVCKATKEVLSELALFANDYLEKNYDVYALRDARYYERMLEEYDSEQGGIVVIRKEGKLCGFFSYGKADTIDIIEPIFTDEEAFLHAVYTLTKDEETVVKCYGYGNERKPMIMAKVLDVQKMIQYIQNLKKHSQTVTVEESYETVQLFAHLNVFLNEFV